MPAPSKAIPRLPDGVAERTHSDTVRLSFRLPSHFYCHNGFFMGDQANRAEFLIDRIYLFMPVTRCPNCRRGLAGYLDGEKKVSDLNLDEVRTEIPKYQAKEARIRARMADLRTGAPQNYPDGAACPGCGHGWREFQHHRKDLEQLTRQEARSALGANTGYLNKLRGRVSERASMARPTAESV